MSGLCWAKRPNTSPCSVTEGIVLSGGSSTEGVLCGTRKGARSGHVCDMTCARKDDCFEKDNTTLQQCDPGTLLEPHARKRFACVISARCGVLFTPRPTDYLGIVISCSTKTLVGKKKNPPTFETSTTSATLSILPKTKTVVIMNTISIAFLEMVVDECDGL